MGNNSGDRYDGNIGTVGWYNNPDTESSGGVSGGGSTGCGCIGFAAVLFLFLVMMFIFV